MCSPMLKIKEKNHCTCLIERKSLTLVAVLPNARKKSLLNLTKALQYNVSQTFATFLQ